MDKFLGQDIPEQERWQFLQDNADAVEKIGYTHRFTPEELAQKKETLAEVSITINDIEIEKKEAMYRAQNETYMCRSAENVVKSLCFNKLCAVG